MDIFNSPGRAWEANHVKKNADSYVDKTQKALSIAQLLLSIYLFAKKIRSKK